jgi:DNA recombination-dependent growth factor C
MGLLKGNPSITRYRVADDIPPEFTEEFVGERLRKYAFVDIEKSPEEQSVGWVELLNDLSVAFDQGTYKFGPNYAFNLREDTRKLSTKILNRYYAIVEAEFVKKMTRKPNSVKKKELKENLRRDLLRRSLLSTDLHEVAWLTKQNEVWLSGSGEKLRALFEDQWNRTFALSIRLLTPITMAVELAPPDRRLEVLDLRPGVLAGEEE